MKLLAEQEEDSSRMASEADLPNFSKAGTGKTYTALEAIRKAGIQRSLVLCPKIALEMWSEEAEGYLGMSTQVIRAGSTALQNVDMHITTYDLAVPLKAKLIETYVGAGAALINDESHYINGPDAKRTKNVFGEQLDLAGGIAERFAQVWNLTGTPMTAYANGMFTQAAVLHPEIFAPVNAETYSKFERMFTFKKQKQFHPRMMPEWKISGNVHEGLLNKLVYLDLKAIRRMEAKGLPPLRERDFIVKIALSPVTRKQLASMTMEQVMQQINDPNSIVAKLWHMVGLLKVPETLPYVGESAKQSPIMLGVWHRDVGQAYYEGLRKMGLEVVQVNGSTKDSDKDHIRKAFNAGLIDVLIGQMQAMGVSWNIQKASSHVVIAEEHPSPSTIEQFYKRVFRYGQENPVQLDFVTADVSIDEILRGVRLRKKASDLKING
jgi:hypothetical protein